MSWYLDSVSPNWKAIIWGDYQSGFPVPITIKGGIHQVVQPIFTREFKLLGQEVPNEVIFEFLQSKYKNVDLRISDLIPNLNPLERIHQILSLGPDVEKSYSKNAKRLIKKSDKLFSYKVISNLDAFFELIKETLVSKIAEFNEENIAKLNALMVGAQRAGKAVCIAVIDASGEFIGAGFFFQHQQKITYLKGTATNAAKKNGAMFGLMNYAINLFIKDFKVFDFGGSDMKNVADFYNKFGATDRIYYHYQLNNLPLWYRLTRKWLKQG